MQRTIFNSAMFSSVGCHRVNADTLNFLLSVIQDVLSFFFFYWVLHMFLAFHLGLFRRSK